MGNAFAQAATGFAPFQQKLSAPTASEAAPKPMGERVSQFLAVAATAVAASPLAALAEEADDYEYGAVDAPIGIAVAGGILAILTAAVPVFMTGGEEAFNEMKDRDAGQWGTGQTEALNKKRGKRGKF